MKRLFPINLMPQIISSVAVASTLGATSLACAQTPANVPPLKAAFAGKFQIGTALSGQQINGGDARGLELALTHFDAFTAENDMKPDALQRVQGQWTFANGDKLVELAQKSGAQVIGHTLVWHQQTPKWFYEDEKGGPLTREAALANLRAHIAGVAGHYKGKIHAWDVVNEAISDGGPDILRPTPALRAIGPDYILEAFRAARAADPNAILVYNDYNLEMAYKRPKAIALLKSLLADGAPIDAVGIQGHLRLDSLNIPEFEKSIQEFGALGLKVAVTELDLGVLPARNQSADLDAREELTAISNPYTQGLPPEIAAKQAQAYADLFAMFARYPHVTRVTLWGVGDGNSWLNNFPTRGRTDYPLLFDRAGRPKPAFFAIQKAVHGAK